MTQTTLNFDAPIARARDPETSKAAARETTPKLPLLQTRFASVFDRPLTASEAAAICVQRFGGLSESYRKRASAAVACGQLTIVGVRACSVTGKAAQIYEANQ